MSLTQKLGKRERFAKVSWCLTAMAVCNEKNDQAPGGLYLCQVNERVSCGACCGLYNVAAPSRDVLNRMLIRRTKLFETVPRNMDAIDAFGKEMIDQTHGNRPFPEFHHCPYLGLIGPAYTRVGCLLHPLSVGNYGADFRGLSFYGGLACSAYFCPACTRSPILLKELICRAADDWYAYGLAITEADLWCAFFNQLMLRRGDADQRTLPADNRTCLKIGRKLLNLKMHWPFQSNPVVDKVNYFFEDNLYVKPDVIYGNGSYGPSIYHEIFKNLVSAFHTSAELILAEEMIDTLIDEMAATLFTK